MADQQGYGIHIEGLRKRYGTGDTAVDALRGVDMQVAPGEVVGLVGPSGSGKTTLLKCLGAVIEPSAGRMTLGSEVIYQEGWKIGDLRALRRDKIGFVFQGFNLLPRMSALENVAMPMGYANVPAEERWQRAHAALAAVGLEDRERHRPSELSGGQQQRVAVARAMVNRPPILLADEPTGALDSKTGEEILALFKRLQAHDHTVVLITHDPDVARHCDRIFVMRDGALHEEGAGP